MISGGVFQSPGSESVGDKRKKIQIIMIYNSSKNTGSNINANKNSDSHLFVLFRVVGR